MRRTARLLLALAFASGVAATAHAHAVLLEAQPADGSVIARPPAEIMLRFNETVTPVFVRVLDAAGHAVTTPEDARATDQTVRLPLPEALPEGTYVVSYRVISADSHPVGESLLFAVGPPGTVIGHPGATHAGDGAWQPLALVDRAMLDLGFLVAVGGALFALGLQRGRPMSRIARRTIYAAAAVAAAAALIGIGVEGGLAGEAPLGALLGPGVWSAGAATTVGRSAALTILGLGIMAAGLWGPAPRSLPVVLGAALAAAGYAVTGHVAIAEPRWLSAPSLWLHVICVAFWVGSLVPLLRVLRADPAQAAPVVARFGRIATLAVALLVLAGAAMATVQLASPMDLLDTPYGERLGFKLVLVAALVLVAVANRLVLTPALLQGRPRAPQWLRRSIALELGLMAAIVATTVTLGQATPPRALAAQARAMRLAESADPPGYFVAIADPRIAAFLEIEPARPGPNRVRLDLVDAGDKPISAIQLTLSLANAPLGIEPSDHAVTLSAPGVYEINDLPIPVAGTWTIGIAALISDFDRRIVTTEVPIR